MKNSIRVAPDTDLAGYPANLFLYDKKIKEKIFYLYSTYISVRI